jgi:hypothetical protein
MSDRISKKFAVIDQQGADIIESIDASAQSL